MNRKKSTKDIGKLNDQLLVFGGVYSNLQSLQKMKQIADQHNISRNQIICTGDVVGYCAQPEQCVQFVKDWGIHCIAGNVEIQLREGGEDCGCNFDEGSRCNIFSNQWYPYAKRQLSESSIKWMHELPDFIQFEYAGLKSMVVHGSMFETAGYVFESTPWSKKEENFKAAEAQLILAGHCGLPFSQTQNEKHWLNPGVIGMPANDGTERVWYMLLNTDPSNKLHFKHHSYTYNHHEAALQMHLHQLTVEYARTLKTGLWDNCEILPEQETALAGKEIVF